MVTETAMFTAIPAGREPEHGHLRVTVFITPRLTTGAGAGVVLPLRQFAAFSNWPATLAGARFAFEVGGAGQLEGFEPDDAVAPDPDLWDRLFGATGVGEAGFQHFEQATVHSYPVDEVARAVTGLFQLIAATSPESFPAVTRGPLQGKLQELKSPVPPSKRWEGGRRQEVKRRLAALRRGSDQRGRFLSIDDVLAAQRPSVSLAAAAAFYDRTEDPWDPATATAPAPAPEAPEFHSFVARCADFPELLRRLGLAIDVLVKDAPGIHERTTVQVLAGVNGGDLETLLAPDQARPITNAHRTERIWAPASRAELPDVVDGSLVVDDARRFLVDQFDPDGSALKVTTLLAELERVDAELRDSAARNGGAPSMTADAASLPALRSAGIIVARHDRAATLVGQFDASAEHESAFASGRAAVLDAADVTRGWRLDIQDEASGTRTWYSLHRRTGEYGLVAPGRAPVPLAVQPAPDEGHVKAASTSSGATAPSADQYLHETLVGWDGWSLAVKRPGRIVDETGVVDPQATPPDVADTGFPLAARFEVQPGSLPRLRYGRRYRVRVRAVDLSGRSIPEDQLDEAHERDLDEPYQRWEPVPSPAVVPLTEYTEGESLMRMVIRSTLGTSVADYIRLDRVRTLPGHAPSGDVGVVYRAENERNLAAPIGSVQLAETHGLFDAALAGDPAAVAQQFAIAARESGSFLTLPGGRVVSTRVPPTVLDGTKSQALPDGEYIVHANRSLPLPYLPDPLARGISFTTLPGESGGGGGGGGGAVEGAPPTRMLRWPGDAQAWYDRRPVLLRIVEGDAPPAFDEPTRTLTVSLPKATMTTVRLSSFLDDADVDLMRVWHLVDDLQAPASAAERATVQRGRHWMVTPFTELTLVHAVEKPLEPPEIRLGPGSRRDAGATFALLPGVVHNHAPSTGRIDIDAAWEDPVDDILEPRPRMEPKLAHVADFRLEAFEVDAQMWPTSGPAAGPYGPRHEVRHEFGDTRHRYVAYTPRATTRFREYFPSEIVDDPDLITSTGPALTVDVPSSARPAPPDVKYIVPTWAWRTEPVVDSGAAFAVRRIRTAGGLRVYLGRPWYSSGPDELLGVVLARQPWITWPADIDRGVVGDVESKALADAWAGRVLEHLGEDATRNAGAVPVGRPETARLSAYLDAVGELRSGERATSPAGEQPAEAEERFLAGIDRAVASARAIDRDLVAAIRTEVASGLVTEFLPWFGGTGPEGRRFTSGWGMDPVFAGERLPAGPFVHQFPLRTAYGTVRLAEVDDRVTVVGHTPSFDEQRRLWYCDVQLETGEAYTPFVQLALARYQPHSVAGQELSPVVLADFVQTMPRREATFVVAADSRAIVVTLRGPVGVPDHAEPLPSLAAEVRASRRVDVWVERLRTGAATDLDWERVGDVTTLDVRLGLAALVQRRYGDVEWAGAVPVPERAEGDRLRVRIAEYELHEGDPIGLAVGPTLGPVRGRRLVYGDSVDLPG